MPSLAVLAAAVSLQVPVDCRVGESCFIQQYADHDPGPGAKDYRCGSLTYDGHDGTDFRLPTTAAQRAGVKVLAAADGMVRLVMWLFGGIDSCKSLRFASQRSGVRRIGYPRSHLRINFLRSKKTFRTHQKDFLR